MNKSISQAKEINKANAMIQALNNTGIRMFMYYPKTKTITVPQKTCEVYQCKAFYENMPHSFAEDYVYKDDYDSFKEMYYKIDRGEKTATATFRSKDLIYCNQVTLTTVSWTDDGQPEDVLGLIENISELYRNEQAVKMLQTELQLNATNEEMEEAVKTVATSIGNQYYAVYHICLETHSYICFREKIKGKLSLIEEKGDYSIAWENYISNNFEKETQKKLREFGDISTLAKRIEKKSMISCDYYRKDVGWTRGKFLAGKKDENGNLLSVVFTVSDINDEIKTLEKKRQAELEALQDPLTRLWNRKAFEQFKENDDYKNCPSGVLLFDIDKFKVINDQHGHDMGDQVIKEVAQAVRGIVRQKDLVFRIGGDEFTILLYNCDISIWHTICQKIETVHKKLKKILPSELNVTLSAGLCINKAGYCDEMIKLADQAMYHTKANGRGGCSNIDLQGQIINEWRDENSSTP